MRTFVRAPAPRPSRPCIIVPVADEHRGDPVVVRLAEDDWPVLRQVRLAALADSPTSFGTTLREAQTYTEHHWRHQLRSGALFVALAGGDLAGGGLAGGGLAGGNPVGMVAGMPRAGDGESGLGAMWVAPSWRGRGVAGQLVTAVVGWAKAGGSRRIDLWAPADKPRACRFYQRQGFVPTGVTRPFPGVPGRFITHMHLDLPPG
jgi:GNAT superfamily N-acetyltransferase